MLLDVALTASAIHRTPGWSAREEKACEIEKACEKRKKRGKTGQHEM